METIDGGTTSSDGEFLNSESNISTNRLLNDASSKMAVMQMVIIKTRRNG